jgi:hypothetical protein
MLDDALIAAYRATDYVLLRNERGSEAEVTLKIGTPNPAFDRILAARGATTAAIVTACNPRSVVLPDAENRTRHAQLVAILEARGFDYTIGEGRDPNGLWPAEVGCVVFGIAVETGLALARAFDQNAIVFVAAGRAPELAYPDR